MSAHGFLLNALIFLAAAVIFVPFSKRFGFGSVLGYLLAGIAIGPAGFRLITNVSDIMHFSEFGVVLLLFLIGLELEPRKLWQMRVPIFGMGTLQVVSCLIGFALCSLLLGFSWQVSLLVGMGFSLSSTALVLQILNERKLMGSVSGRSAFSILLFQDVAVIPMIAILPLLGVEVAKGSDGSLLSALSTVGILVAVLVLGRFLLRPLLHWIAGVQLREIFTALALLLVISMAALMQHLEISMGLGAFMAGILLADSEYRHALETDIEPFKGLLLGLFFISVGMSVDLQVIATMPLQLLGGVLLILVLKFAIHYAIGLSFQLPRNQLWFFALVLAQVGEFAFVLFDAGERAKIISQDQESFLVALTAISILMSPIFVKLYDWLLLPLIESCPKPSEDQIQVEEDTPVIIAGFGRVGQIVGRFLFANGIKATVLDYEPDQVETLRQFGFKIFYGDATRHDLLEAAGAMRAKILVNAIDDVDTNLALVDTVKEHFPHLKIVCRARNVNHVLELRARGVEILERETFDSALRLGRSVLEELGLKRYQAFTMAQKFRALDIKLLDVLMENREDMKIRISLAKQAREDIEKLFAAEAEQNRKQADGWSEYETERKD